jgi:hypothetical protein
VLSASDAAAGDAVPTVDGSSDASTPPADGAMSEGDAAFCARAAARDAAACVDFDQNMIPDEWTKSETLGALTLVGTAFSPPYALRAHLMPNDAGAFAGINRVVPIASGALALRVAFQIRVVLRDPPRPSTGTVAAAITFSQVPFYLLPLSLTETDQAAASVTRVTDAGTTTDVIADTFTISSAVWHRVELVTTQAATGNATMKVTLDGKDIPAAAGATVSHPRLEPPSVKIQIGPSTVVPSGAVDIDFDDILVTTGQ